MTVDYVEQLAQARAKEIAAAVDCRADVYPKSVIFYRRLRPGMWQDVLMCTKGQFTAADEHWIHNREAIISQLREILDVRTTV